MIDPVIRFNELYQAAPPGSATRNTDALRALAREIRADVIDQLAKMAEGRAFSLLHANEIRALRNG